MSQRFIPVVWKRSLESTTGMSSYNVVQDNTARPEITSNRRECRKHTHISIVPTNFANLVKKFKQVCVIRQMSEVSLQQIVASTFQIQRIVDGRQTDVFLKWHRTQMQNELTHAEHWTNCVLSVHNGFNLHSQ